MAFSYVTSDTMRIENKHIELALHYAKLDMPDKAFNEYYSMIKLHPYIADLYYDASKYLIAQQKYGEALELVESSPVINKDYYYYYMTGTLRLKTFDTEQGIKDLEYAYQNMASEAKPTSILLPLYAAYRNIGDEENEIKIYNLIKQYVPDFGRSPEKEGAKQVVQKLTIDEAIAKAEEFIRNKEYKIATELLLTINEGKEDIRANRLLGATAMLQNDIKTAYKYYLKVYRDDSHDVENINNLFILSLMNNDTKTALEYLKELRVSTIDQGKLLRLEGLYNKKTEELKKK
jgi:tetratricopeptide (TPR) repeat protein